MSKIIYHSGSLFKAPRDKTILVHACNCMGMWGSGIAKEFARRFPEAYYDYKEFCQKHCPENTIGMGVQFHSPGLQSIGYLFTSRNYGRDVDPEDQILLHTKQAIRCLVNHLPNDFEIHAPKINSGLFRVPWDMTERFIEQALVHSDVKFHVWEG